MPTWRDLPACDGCDQPSGDAFPDDRGYKFCSKCRQGQDQFAAYLKKASAEVATWPAWKRNLLGRLD